MHGRGAVRADRKRVVSAAAPLPAGRGSSRWFVEALAAVVVTLGCATEYVALGAQATSALPGAQAAAYGVLLGILTAVIGVPLASLTISTRPMISGPRVASTILMSSLVARLLGDGSAATLGMRGIVALACCAVVVAGVVQLALGALRGGSLVRMVPAPVLSGLLFGVAGLAMQDQFAFVAGCVIDWHVAAIGIATVGVAAHFGWKMLCRRVARRVALPPGLSLFAALLASAACYYAAVGVLPLPPSTCRLVGIAGLDLHAWRPFDAGVWRMVADIADAKLWILVLGYGALIGVISSIDTVIAVSSIEAQTHRRGSVNHDLLGFGAVNVLLGALTLLPCVGSVTRSGMAIAAGARTRAVAWLHAALVLVALTVGLRFVAMLPKLSAAVVVIAMSLDMIDDWSKQLTTLAFSDREPRGVIGGAMWLFAVEAAATLATGQPSIGFAAGCAAGVLLAWPSPRTLAVSFAQRGDTLAASADGALLCYNADTRLVAPLLKRIDAEPAPARVALDLTGVRRIDATACRALAQFDRLCTMRGVESTFVLPSSRNGGEEVADALRLFLRLDALKFSDERGDVEAGARMEVSA